MKNIILKLTYKIWSRPVQSVLNKAYEDGLINSYQWHVLAASFDRTQNDGKIKLPEKNTWGLK